MSHHRSTVLAALAIGAGVFAAESERAVRPARSHDSVLVVERAGAARASLGRLSAQALYSVTLSARSPMSFGASVARARVLDARGEIGGKSLHRGDPDLYLAFRPRQDGDGVLELDLAGEPDARVELDLRVLGWPRQGAPARLEAEPNDTWREANPIFVGETFYATADDAPFIAVGDDRKAPVLDRGVDWYRLELAEARDRLLYFQVELQERDNVPLDVSVYTIAAGKPVAYERGIDPVSPPHEVQALPGNKFTTRVAGAGTYYVRVAASHPAYSLRVSAYDVPPYREPADAVRVAADYLALAGDSWHANTPRRGGITDRVANVHAETSTCIACHPTHFTTRGVLTAHQNGYPVRMRRELQFLTERLYNNPRPFYGFPEASWARLISAPANVLGRIGGLMTAFERSVTGEPRTGLLRGIGAYLDLYYRDRTKLPADETNGNTPLVSAYEVAFYGWAVFDELARRTGEPGYAVRRDRLRRLLEETRHTNLVDLCYQTIALATIDRQAYRDRLAENARRIFALQRPDGQWSMLLDPAAPAVEFQTGHCLYALALAGYTAADAPIARAVEYLLRRQQEFGGWFDPLQSYENFRTPFRETQFAVMALSELYKKPAANGWGAAFPPSDTNPRLDGSAEPGALVGALDRIWERPEPRTLQRVEALARHPEALVRYHAALTLGRVGERTSVPQLERALGDATKMVQIGAAWGLRQLATRRAIGHDAIARALTSPSDRVRWGASRVFATHFSYLSDRLDLADRVFARMSDPSPTVRMAAARALWQWWYWNASDAFRARVEDAFLDRLGTERDPWVRRNLTEGLYNVCDENVRYLYNNWIPLLGRAADRDRAASWHRAVGTRQARSIVRALEEASGTDRYALLRDGILTSLAEFHLRRSDHQRPEVVARIGNDIETIRFYPEAAAILEPALAALARDPSPEVRARALETAPVVRDSRADVFAAAVVRALLDPEAAVRASAARFYRSVRLATDPPARRGTAALLAELLRSRYREAKLAALELAGQSGGTLSAEPDLLDAVKAAAVYGDAQLETAALRAAASAFPSLMFDPEVLSVPRWALETASRPATARQVPDALLSISVELALTQPALASHPAVVEALDRLASAGDPKFSKAALDAASRSRSAAASPRLQAIVADALASGDAAVARQARELARRTPALARNAAVAAALAASQAPPAAVGPSGRESYGVAARSSARLDALPDYRYFVEKVMPILSSPGPDGMACVQCHATHTLLRLAPPRDGAYSEDATRENYRSALRAVDLESPERSLILVKPISTADVEGTLGTGRVAHGGGARWSGPDHPAYRTVLDWIRGATQPPVSEKK